MIFKLFVAGTCLIPIYISIQGLSNIHEVTEYFDNDNYVEDINEDNFKAVLLSSIGDSIKGILEEEGIDSRGLFEDIRDVVKLAKDLGFDENESFFSKVAALLGGNVRTMATGSAPLD